MAKKIIKTTLPWTLILCLGVIIILAFSPGKPINVKADNADTSVSVSNIAPVLSGEKEDPASTIANPTNMGSDVTFKGTGTDTNGEQYYLALCKTDAISAGNNAPPTCTDGNWCISSATNSGVEATCSYTALQGDAPSNNWYAFVCDKVIGGGSCSVSGQGSGDSGSPFYVNHRPTLDGIGVNDNTPDPGQTLIVTTSTADSDSDTVSLFVCKENDFNGTGCGAGGTWCTALDQVDDPSCQFDVPTPSEGSDSYYGFLIDAHNFPALGGQHGIEQIFTVNNVAPVVSSVTLNGGSDISLVESSTQNIVVTASATDNNGCTDINTDSTSDTSIYRSGIGWAGCDIGAKQNNNNCYAIKDCVYDIGSCSGGTDVTSTFTCTVAIQYHADPTDVNTQYPTENWLATVKSSDEALYGIAEIGTGVETLSLTALDVTSSIGYGGLNPGQASSSDQNTTVTATGNVGLDPEYSGANMSDGNGHTIAVDQQKYDFTGGKIWDLMDYSLSDTPTSKPLHCKKTIITGSPETKPNYWRIKIPDTQASGSYTGTDSLGAYKSDPVNW